MLVVRSARAPDQRVRDERERTSPSHGSVRIEAVLQPVSTRREPFETSLRTCPT